MRVRISSFSFNPCFHTIYLLTHAVLQCALALAGGYGRVYRARYNGRFVAVKTFTVEGLGVKEAENKLQVCVHGCMRVFMGEKKCIFILDRQTERER